MPAVTLLTNYVWTSENQNSARSLIMTLETTHKKIGSNSFPIFPSYVGPGNIHTDIGNALKDYLLTLPMRRIRHHSFPCRQALRPLRKP